MLLAVALLFLSQPLLMPFLLSMPIIILPDPPETALSMVFLGITFSMRPVLRRIKPPWGYQHTYTWKNEA